MSTSYDFIIIIMTLQDILWYDYYYEIAFKYALHMLSVFTLWIKCMNKINSASDYCFQTIKLNGSYNMFTFL